MINDVSHAAWELVLHAKNDRGCCRAWLEPAWRNLERKIRKETFSYELAIRLLKDYTLTNVAKDHHREHGSMADAWHQIFPPSVRQEAAEILLDEFLNELRAGNSWIDTD